MATNATNWPKADHSARGIDLSIYPLDPVPGAWIEVEVGGDGVFPVVEPPHPPAFGLHGSSVTGWRRTAQGKAEEIVALITRHADPETRYAIARAIAEDIQHEINTALRREFGRVFDPLLDGPH